MSPPASQETEKQTTTQRNVFLVFGARLVFIAALWLTISRWIISPSERFYVAAPLIFAADVLWMAVRGQRKRAIRRAGIIAIAVAVLLFVLTMDSHRPSHLFQPFERSVMAYVGMSLVVIASWLWKLVVASLGHLLYITPAGPLWKSLSIRILNLFLYALILNAYLLSFLETHWPKQLDTATPARYRLAFEDVTWVSRDGTRIVGWFVPTDGSTRTAIVCHGVGAYKADMREFIRVLHRSGFNVLAFDFRGHGESGGHTVTYGLWEKWDIITGIDMLRETYPDRSRQIVGVGWSMGAASLILAAAEDRRIEALHLDAAYARTFDIAKVIAEPLPPVFEWTGLYLGTALGCLETGTNLFVQGPVRVIASIAPRPIRIVHGDADRIIPIEQGRLLYEAAGQPKQWHVIRRAGHCQTLAIESPVYEQQMIAFLNNALDSPSMHPSQTPPTIGNAPGGL